MESDTYGGGFLYHMDGNKIAMGFVTGLNYTNPYLSRLKSSSAGRPIPISATTSENDKGEVTAKRLGYGARAITAGGLLSLPKTVFPGGALVGCDAGFLNVSRIRATPPSRQGMLAGDAAFDAQLWPVVSMTSLSAIPRLSRTVGCIPS